MARSVTICVRVTPEIKAAAESAAADDYRSVASLIEKALVEHLRHRGYLPPRQQTGRPQLRTINNPLTHEEV